MSRGFSSLVIDQNKRDGLFKYRLCILVGAKGEILTESREIDFFFS